ncbi:hypothetical protein GCM10011335_30240 [Aureimonas glaciei]|uniref:Uncharacterized protein n=1 Tax=Aureimonas glaciei TaxID=1776957 RepID=A0A917DC19_9HYPH|nr:hypothetical protein GCM10011335_30240 [Aureimonas glaciei]
MAGIAARGPNKNDHAACQMPDGDDALLATVLTNVWPVESLPREDFSRVCEIETALLKSTGPLRRIEGYSHG